MKMVMVPKGIFTTMPISACRARRRLYRAAPGHLRHHYRATVAPHHDPSALCIPGEKTGADAEIGERGAG